jgi:S-adenosylmethionine decarboxylase
MKIGQLGRHILIELYNCDKEILNNCALIEKYMDEAAAKSKAVVVKSMFHMFSPWGVSGAVIIKESHLTVHTWPEYGFAAVDLFTCGESIDPWAAFDYLFDKLKAQRSETTEIPRGVADKIIHFSNGEYTEIQLKSSKKTNMEE